MTVQLADIKKRDEDAYRVAADRSTVPQHQAVRDRHHLLHALDAADERERELRAAIEAKCSLECRRSLICGMMRDRVTEGMDCPLFNYQKGAS